jgi:hypothetical protein
LLSGYQHWKDRRWQKFIRLHWVHTLLPHH